VTKQQAEFIKQDFLRRFSSQYNVAARGIDSDGNKVLTFQQTFPLLEQILIRAGFDFDKFIMATPLALCGRAHPNATPPCMVRHGCANLAQAS
jgi:hypothetical protein